MKQLKTKYTCSLILINDLIGGKWKQRILWHIINGDNRFSLLQKSISDISHKVLISQLKELEHNGIIIRKDFHELPLRVEYYLSKEYEDIIPILDSLCTFANNYANKNNISIDNKQI